MKDINIRKFFEDLLLRLFAYLIAFIAVFILVAIIVVLVSVCCHLFNWDIEKGNCILIGIGILSIIGLLFYQTYKDYKI
jgi:hypothetical protein